MLDSMKPGSVVVDLAAEAGGNIEGCKPGTTYVYGQGVTVIGETDFPSQLSGQSSQLYANNISSLMMVILLSQTSSVHARASRQCALHLHTPSTRE